MAIDRNSTKGRKALGKGLGALIPGANSGHSVAAINRDFMTCPIERIHPREDQPRQHFDEEALKGLAESIKEQGVIQPPVVRRRTNGDGFEIIAGERRWRASQLAGLKEIPIVVRDVDSAEAFEMALVENLQREDLNPIEEAEALSHLIEEQGYSQVEVAARIGRDRSTVANSLRLLQLPMIVRSLVVEGKLTEGHARAILQADTETKMIALGRMVAAKNLSVRETERRARAESGKTQKNKPEHSPDTKALIEKLQRALGARVNIVDRKGKGRIEVSYSSYDELDGILAKILK